MSYCKEIGKDKIIFLSEEDGKKPSTIEFTQPEEEPVGLVTKDGDINWSCPCIGNMAIGPCGVEFREAFSCFHNRYLQFKTYTAVLGKRHKSMPILLHKLC